MVSVNDCSVFVMERERKGGAPSTYDSSSLPAPYQQHQSSHAVRKQQPFAFRVVRTCFGLAGAHLALDAMGADLALANRKVGFACRLEDAA